MEFICADRQQSLQRLNEALSRKYQSLADYIVHAGPYVAPGRESLFEAIRSIVADDHRMADKLADQIEDFEGVPNPRFCQPDYASLNYLSLDYLAGLLIEELEQQIKLYDAHQDPADHEVIRRMFESLSISTHRQLETLKTLIQQIA